MVSLLNTELPWWTGVSDIEERFGRALDVDAMRSVPVQMVVGAEDTQTWEITIPEGSSWWMPGANDAGANRIERLRSLQQSFEASGIAVQFDVVPGTDHNGWAVLPPGKRFFSDCLSKIDNPESSAVGGAV